MNEKDKITPDKLREKISNYVSSIYNFEKYIENIYNPSIEKIYHEGYIINLKDFNQLKSNIQYEYLKQILINKNSALYLGKIGELINIKGIINILSIDQEKFISPTELINSLNNKSNYLLINKALWRCICKIEKQNEPCITYFIDNSKIILLFDNNHNICFKKNKNILNKESYLNGIHINELINLVEPIIEYYNLEHNFLANLKNKLNAHKESGYLLDKKWIDEWKNSIYYEEIRNHFLKANFIINDNQRNNFKN